MKLFGEYLVEKEIISEAVLVEAVVFQIKALPSIAETVHQHKLIENKLFLDVIRQQHHKQCGFVEAASSLGLWTSQIAGEVEKRTLERRIPLGEVLVKMGSVKIEK